MATRRVPTDQERMWRAYHEAGHAVRAVAWQVPVASASIERCPKPDPELGVFLEGVSSYRPVPDADSSPLELRIGLTICAAGEAAERRYRLGRRAALTPAEEQAIVHAARGDHRNIREYHQYIPEEHEETALRWQHRDVTEWVQLPETWSAIQLVAHELYHHGVMNGWQLGAALQRHRYRALADWSMTTNPPASAEDAEDAEDVPAQPPARGRTRGTVQGDAGPRE